MIWAFIPASIRRALMAVAAGLALWLAGRRSGAVRTADKAARADLKDMQTAKEVRDANDAKSDAAVRGDLSRWMRPD